MKAHGVIIGRFQPWHVDHRKLYEEVKEEYDFVTIAIYVTNPSLSNPFYPEEVYRMIRNDPAFDETITTVSFVKSTKNPWKLKNRIYQVIKNNADCYGGTDDHKSEIVTRDFSVCVGLKLLGFNTVKKNGTKEINASQIREMIYNNDENYKKYVNAETISLVKSIFPERYYQLFEIGKKPKRNLVIM